MRGSMLRRISSGVFLVWFAVFGLTRGILGVCPEHGGAHRAAIGAVTTGAASGAHAPSHEHGAQAAHGAQHHASAGLAEASPGATETAPADQPASHGCDCRGECCCCATVRVAYASAVVLAPASVIALPRHEITSVPDRQIVRVHFSLPFATAPPLEQTA